MRNASKGLMIAGTVGVLLTTQLGAAGRASAGTMCVNATGAYVYTAAASCVSPLRSPNTLTVSGGHDNPPLDLDAAFGGLVVGGVETVLPDGQTLDLQPGSVFWLSDYGEGFAAGTTMSYFIRDIGRYGFGQAPNSPVPWVWNPLIPEGGRFDINGNPIQPGNLMYGNYVPTWWKFTGSIDAEYLTRYGATSSTSSPVPEPATVLLLGAGLVGLASSGLRRRKHARQS